MPLANASFDETSILLLWTAIGIYALAFVAHTVDLAKRAQLVVAARDNQAAVRELAFVGGGKAPSSGDKTTDAVTASEKAPRFLMARVGTTLMILAFLFHLAATVLRGVAAHRVPWSNMYEFAMTGTLLMSAVYLGVLVRKDLRYLGTFISGLVVILLGSSALSFYVEVAPLQDSLRSPWLVIHVFVATLGTAFFALAFALSVLQLLQTNRESRLIAYKKAGSEGRKPGPAFLATLPKSSDLEAQAYRFAIIGFIFWTFTLIAGAIWAQAAWSRYWGFDVKEVWTFIIWVLYAGYIHARATRGWQGTRSAWLSIVGFSAVIFNFTVVNMFFKGLHSYSGLN